MPASSHIRQVCSCPRAFCFLFLHSNIAVLHVSASGRGGGKRGCDACYPRRSASNFVGVVLANGHVRSVRPCPFGAALLFRLKVSPLFPAVNKMLGKVALRDYRVASAALRDGKSIAKRVGSEPNASRYDKGENYEQL